MALPPPRLAEPLPDLLAVDDVLQAHPAARRALRMGLLEARRAALIQARSLIAWGRPLPVAIIAVSFLHLWDTIAAIRPVTVPELALPGWLYHATAAALTLAIDAAALFCLAAGAVTSRAGERLRRSWGLGFFLVTTFLLNAAFVVRYAPALGADVRARVLPGLELLFAILLPATVPVGLFAVEGALARLTGRRAWYSAIIRPTWIPKNAAGARSASARRVRGGDGCLRGDKEWSGKVVTRFALTGVSPV